MPVYPRIREFLNEEINQFAKANDLDRDQALQRICRELGVKSSVLDSWRRGKRRPSDETMSRLARVLRGEKDAEGFWVIWEKAREERVKAWAERIEAGDVALRIQSAVYPGAGEFWREIFDRLLGLGRIKHHVQSSERKDFLQLRDMVWTSGGLDVALGILATPEMLIKLQFIVSPIRYRVNFVVLDGALEREGLTLEALRNRLAPHAYSTHLSEANSDAIRKSVKFVAMRGEVGHRYLEHILSITLADDVLIDRLDAKKYVKQLLESSPSMAVADEITCLDIIRALGRSGRASLLFPLRTGLPSDLTLPGSLLPEYPLGIAVSRNTRANNTGELLEYLDQSIGLLWQANARWVAGCYLKLRSQIDELARQALPNEPPRNIERWLDHTFRLNTDLSSLVGGIAFWKPVLEHANALRAMDQC